MKNQYVGDINDFCKYGLLRVLTERGRHSTTVAWMLTPDDSSAHGGKLAYLSHPDRWRSRDPELFDFLAVSMADGQARTVATIETSIVMPGAQFVAEYVPRGPDMRAAYFGRLLRAAADSELIFFDPDNGLEVASCPPGRPGSDKYLLWTELAEAYAAGHSVLVYQHFPRRRRDHFIAELAARIGEITSARQVLAFRTAGVVFLLVPQIAAADYYARRAKTIADEWRDAIEVVSPQGVDSDALG